MEKENIYLVKAFKWVNWVIPTEKEWRLYCILSLPHHYPPSWGAGGLVEVWGQKGKNGVVYVASLHSYYSHTLFCKMLPWLEGGRLRGRRGRGFQCRFSQRFFSPVSWP